ncbi:MAG: autotransporter-associated beta strand repeat-containing protein [Luteolibacter sp.]
MKTHSALKSRDPSTLFRRVVLAMKILACVALCASPAAAQESVYNGAFSGGTGSLANAITFENNSGKGLSIINIFRNWGNSDSTNVGFPTSTLSGIRDHGSIPLVTWQPQANSARDGEYQLADIINGNHDSFIKDWALDAKAWAHPFFLRFAHEMNGNWYPWSPGINGNTTSQYAAAWRHVHDIFTRNGVTNVTWVWCPNTIYSGGTPIASLYPGDNYVDWTSSDVYNRISNNWGNFSARGGSTLDELMDIAPGKPIMIAETGCHNDDDKAGVAAGSKAQWYRTALKSYLKDSMPRVKAWVYFNGNNPDGNDWRINTSPDVLAAYKESIGLTYYSDNKYGSITQSPIPPLVNDAKSTDTMGPFVSIEKPGFNKVAAGTLIEILVSASDKSGVNKVEYSINGVLTHTENIAPYQYFWPVPAGAGTTYTLVAKAFDAVGKTTVSTITVVSQDPPAAPAGVAATDGAFTDKVRVTWSSVASVNGYEIWRNGSNDSAGAVKLNTGTQSGTTYDDTTTVYGTTYYYWVKAVTDAGAGNFGTPDTGFRNLPAAPVAPTGLYATDGTYNSRVQLGWTGVANAAGYEIWRNSVNNSATAVKISGSLVAGTTYDDITVPYATVYYYWAKAVNDGGTSPFSGVASGFRGSVPTITDITNRTISQNGSTGAIAFTVGDANTAVADLIVSATSSAPGIVPVENIVLGGSGASRTVTVTPANGAIGSSIITVTVTDADGGQASDSFTLIVNALPVISSISDRVISVGGSTGAVAFTVGDAETAAASLTLSASSSDTVLVPLANIVFGGSGANRTFTVTPAAGKSGAAEISVTVGDGTGSATETFFLSVMDANQALWTATGSPRSWSTGANWFSGVSPVSGNSTTLGFLSGIVLPAGSITSTNDLASPFSQHAVTLAGSGPAGAAAVVNLTGGALDFKTAVDGAAPGLHLAANAGDGPGSSLGYHIGMPVVLSSTLTIDGNGTADFVLDGGISGAAGISKTGTATLVLAGAGSYTGSTVMKGGTLRVTHPAGLGANGALQTNTGAVAPVIQLHIDGAGNDGVIPMSNAFGGNSSITTTIDVANNGGGNSGNLISLDGVSTGWGNTVTLNVTGSNGYGLRLAQLRSTGGSAGTQTLNPTTAPLTVGSYTGANNATTLTLSGTHSGSAITGAIVNGSSIVSLTKSNSSTWVLGGNSSYSGVTNILGGTLVLAADNALGTTAGTTTVSSGGGRLALRGNISVAEPISLSGRASGDHLLNESGTNTLTSSLSLNTGENAYFIRSDGGKLVLGNAVNMLGSTASKTLFVSGDGNVEIAGAVSPGTGTLSLSKTDGGTLTLSADSTYNGPTTILAGTLDLRGNLTATSSVTVATGAKLTGSGSISAATAVDGIHAPGAGIGQQAFATTLSYGGSARLEWELAANNADLVAPADPENPGPPVGIAFDGVSANTATVAAGAVFDVVLNGPGSAVDFRSAFWQQPHSWPALSADSLEGGFALGSVSTDSGGRSAAAFGGFSVRHVGSTIEVLWDPTSPFLVWQEQQFGEDATDPEIAGENADPDGDGLTNLVEYALATGPLSGNPSGISCAREGGVFSMTYALSKAATDITVLPVWSDDLATWSNVGVAVGIISENADVRVQRAEIPVAEDPNLFLRLRITRP